MVESYAFRIAHVHESVELRDEQEGHEQQTGNADHAAGVCRDLD